MQARRPGRAGRGRCPRRSSGHWRRPLPAPFCPSSTVRARRYLLLLSWYLLWLGVKRDVGASLPLAVVAAERERGVGATEAEAVGHDAVDVDIVPTLAHDRHVGHGGIDGLDIGGLANESVVHHQQRIDRLVDPGGAERMTGERLGCADRRRL